MVYFFFNSRNAPKFPCLSKIGTELLRNMMAAVTRTNDKISKTSTWHVHHAFLRNKRIKSLTFAKNSKNM